MGRLLVELRRDGVIPYGWIADSIRWQRKPRTWDSAEEAIRETARLYRRNVWRDLKTYVEVWCEKDALAGVLYDVTQRCDVPLMVTRGYPSLTYLHDAAQAMAEQVKRKKNVFIYYFGDWDPSGVDIRRNVEGRLHEFMSQSLFGPYSGFVEPVSLAGILTFEAVAVEPWQIEELAEQSERAILTTIAATMGRPS